MSFVHFGKESIYCSRWFNIPSKQRLQSVEEFYSPEIIKFLISFAHVGETFFQMLDYVFLVTLQVTFDIEVLSAASLPFFHLQNEKAPSEIFLTSYLLSSMSVL